MVMKTTPVSVEHGRWLFAEMRRRLDFDNTVIPIQFGLSEEKKIPIRHAKIRFTGNRIEKSLPPEKD